MIEYFQTLTSVDFIHYMLALVAIKALTLGSDFSFYYAIRDGKKYLSWYSNRTTYNGN